LAEWLLGGGDGRWSDRSTEERQASEAGRRVGVVRGVRRSGQRLAKRLQEQRELAQLSS
jgi:hypothetical protein